MVAFVSATPNPVVFTWPDITEGRRLDVDVGWATGDNRPGRVTIAIDGVARPPVPAAGAPSGTTRFQIGSGQSATAELTSLDGRTSYGLTTITTAKDALASYMTDPDRTFIQKLNVSVGVDSLAVSFTTPKDAVGFLLLRRRDTGIAVAAPMEPDFGQQHHLSVTGLAQDTTYDLSVIALRPNAQGGVTLGSGAKNPTEAAAVTTGSRTVTVFFDSISVRNDSDPGGTGELHFALGAGGVVPSTDFGQAYFDDEDFGDGGERAVGLSVAGPRAPVLIWIRADGYDDDGGFFTGVGVGGFVRGMTPAGTHGEEFSGLARAEVTVWVDTNELAAGRRVPVVLETGSFALAYTVFAAVQVERRPGTVRFLDLRPLPQRPRLPFGRRLRDSMALTARRRVPIGSPRGQVRASLLPPDGALALVRATGSPGRNEELVELGIVPTVAVAIEDAAGRGWVFAADAQARVLALSADADGPAPDDPLPVRAVGLAVAAPHDRLILVAVDPDGVLWTVDVADGRAVTDPRPIGERITAELTTLTSGSGAVSVFARRDDGQIVHRRLSSADEPRDGRWDELGLVGPGELSAEWVDDGSGVLVHVVLPAGGETAEAVLYWPSYPEPNAWSDWAGVPAP
jgi:hypothetical protein